jgi:hypothetical protein
MLGLRCELADRHVSSIMRRRSGQTFCGTLPAPSLPPCEIHVQMRPRPYSRAIGRSASASSLLPPGVRALAQCILAAKARTSAARSRQCSGSL